MSATIRRLLLLLALIWSSIGPVGAAAPYGWVRPDGQPFRWDTTQPISYAVDQGPLGRLTNADAVATIQTAFQRWDEVDTAAISFVPTAPLTEDITGANFESFRNNLPPGVISVILDNDGSIIRSLLGDATAAVAVGRPVTTDPANGRITAGFVIINGLFIDGRFNPDDLSLFDLRGMVVQEIGRALGLGYSQLNTELILDGIPENNNLIPQMWPRPVAGNGDQLTADDRASLTALYPNPGLTGTIGTIRGQVLLPDGVTGLQGINVIARRLGDPTVTAVSAISGVRFKNEIGPDAQSNGGRQVALRGAFELTGLPPGTYVLSIEALRPESLAGPLRQPAFLPGGVQFYRQNAPATSDPNQTAPITLAPGQVVENANFLLNVPAGPALQNLNEQEPNQFPEQAQNLPLAARVQGSIQPSDASGVTVPLPGGGTAPVQDLYRLTLTGPTLLTVTLSSANVGSDLNLYLLSGPVATAPRVVAISSDTGTPPEAFQLRVPGGVYFVAVGLAGGPATAYTLDLNGTAAPEASAAPPQRPRLNNLFVVNITPQGANAAFISDLPSNTIFYVSNPLVEYSNPSLNTDHRQGLTNLAQGTAYRLQTLAVTPSLGIGRLPDVFFNTALPALPGGVGQVFAGVTDIIEDPDDPNAAYVVLSLRNVGTGDASSVTITSLVPAQGWQFSSPLPTPIGLGFLGRGGSGVILTRLVKTGPTDNAPLVSGAGTYFSQGVGTQPFNFGGAVAFLTVQKSVTPSTARPGDTVQFTLTVTNGGQGPATGVILSDTLPSGLQFLNADPGGFFQNGNVFWNFSRLEANSSVTVSFRARVLPTTAGGTTITNVALARSNESPTPIASNVVPLDVTAPPPQLRLTKSANRATAGPGEVITYTLDYSNVGGTSASNVVLTDSLPAGTVFVDATGGASVSGGVVTWSIGSLGQNQTGQRQLRVQVQPGTTGGAVIQNIAQLAAAEAPAAISSNPVSVTVTSGPPQLRVTKSANATSARSGDNLTYTLTVANTGAGPATNVRLFDQVPGDTRFVSAQGGGAVQNNQVVWTLGNIQAGNSATVGFTVQVQPSAADATVINNIALATSNEIPNGVASNNVAVGIIALPQLQLIKSANPQQARPGDIITFSLILANNGSGPATSTRIFDQVPNGTTFVGADAGGALQGTQVVWTLGTVAPGGSATVSFRAQVQTGAAGSINNIAQVTSAEVPNGVASNAVQVGVLPAPGLPPQLRLTKQADQVQARPGDIVTFTITAANVGQSPATNVQVFDDLPIGTTLVNTTGGGQFVDANTIGWNLGTLQPGGTISVLLRVQLSANLPGGGTVTNLAAVRSTELPNLVASNNGQPTVVTIISPPQPQLRVTKQADRQTAAPGDTINYTLTFQNLGPGTATNVQLIEAIPANTQFLEAPGASFTGNSLIWSIGTLPAGGNGARTLRVRVLGGVPAGTPINNTAQVDSNETAAVASNTVTVTVGVPTAPVLQIQKSVDRSQAAPGDTLTYQITFANTGNGAATNVSVQDPLPANTSFQFASDGGAPFGNTVQWQLGTLQAQQQRTVTLQLRVNQGTQNGTQIANQARISSNELQAVVSNFTITTVVVTPPSQLVVEKAADVSTTQPGGLINYTITVGNVGGSNATGVLVSDVIPAGTTGVFAQDGGVIQGGVATWSLGTLAPNQTRQVRLRVQVNNNASGQVTNTAQARSNEVPTPIASDAISVTVNVPTNVTIQKAVNQTTATPGTTIRYDITFRNNGPVALSGGNVSDPIPAGTTLVSATQGAQLIGSTLVWNLTTPLQPNETRAVAFEVRINQNVQEGTQITNQATFNVPAQQYSVNSNAVTTTVSVPIELTIQKAVDRTTAGAGDELNYTITIRNDGDATVTGAVIRDQLPGNVQFLTATGNIQPQGGVLSWNVLPIAPNQAGQVTFRVRVLPGTPAGTQITNQATIQVPARGFTLNSNPVTTTVQQAPVQISLQKAVDRQQAAPGDILTYAIRYANNSQQVANDLVIVDTVPANTTFVGAQGGGVLIGNQVRYSLPGVGPGGADTVTFTVRVNPGTPAGTQITNQAQITGPQLPQPVPSNVVATSVAAAAINLSLTKQVDKQQAAPGQELTYTISYANNGPQTFTQVVIADALSPVTNFVSANPPAQLVGGDVRWQIAQIPPGGTGSVQFTVRITGAAQPGGSIPNQARITAAQLPSPITSNTVQTAIVPAQANLSLQKQVDRPTALPGDILTYTLSYEVNGSQTFTQLQIVDPLPPNTEFVDASGNGVLDGGSVRWQLPPVATAASQVSFRVRVLNTAPPGTVITNRGQIGGPEVQQPVQSNAVNTTVGQPPTGNVTLAKQVDKQQAPAGDTLTYTLTFNNASGQTLTQVQIADEIPTGTTFESATQGGQYIAQRNEVRWVFQQPVGPGQSGSVSFTVRINPNTPEGTRIRNQGRLGAAQFPDAVGSNVVDTTVGGQPGGGGFAGTWYGITPQGHSVSLTVDPQNRFTVWAVSQDLSTIARAAQGRLNADGSFDVRSADQQVRFTGQIAADRQSAQIAAERGPASFTATVPRMPDVGPLPAALVGTWNGFGQTANGDRIQVRLSIDPQGNSTFQAEVVRAGTVALRQQFARFWVTADGRLTDPQSNQQVGVIQQQGNQLVLTYNFVSTAPPPYQNTFQVPLQPLQ